MHRLAVLACLAGCGRLGFGDDTSTGDGGGTRGDAFVPTGPMGPRWITKFTTDNSTAAFGRNGEVGLIARMRGTFNADPGVSLIGQGFINTALVRFDATGIPLSQTVLDSNGFCDMRAAVLDGDVVYLAGFTSGTQAIPAYGACSIVTNRQDPIAIRIDSQGNQTLAAHWTAGGANAQAWQVVLMPDHSLTMNGIYGSQLMIGTNAMPMATTDPSVWIARTGSTTTDVVWARGFTAPAQVHGGPLSTDGDDVCILGSHGGAATVFGQALTFAGAFDSWIARVDSTGTARWVRSIGSTSMEDNFGEGGILALPDGGCLIGIESDGNITLDTGTYPVSDGVGLAVRFAGDGAITYARRFTNTPHLTFVGNRLIASYNENGDAVITEIDLQGGPDKMLGVVGGAGTQDPVEIVAVGPDVVAVTVNNTGALTFGTTTFDTGATTMGAMAVLGI